MEKEKKGRYAMELEEMKNIPITFEEERKVSFGEPCIRFNRRRL